MSVKVAKAMGIKRVGLMNMTHSFKVSPSWTVEQSLQYRICYNPEIWEYFAITPLFEMYIAAMLNICGEYCSSTGAEIFNLTPHGYLYMMKHRYIPYMLLEEYINGARGH
jgi:hypothetical protein